MNDNNIVLEASSKLRQLSYEALAEQLERGAIGAIPRAGDVLRKHHFHRLADQLREAGKSHETS